jgi:hypothetical protein
MASPLSGRGAVAPLRKGGACVARDRLYLRGVTYVERYHGLVRPGISDYTAGTIPGTVNGVWVAASHFSGEERILYKIWENRLVWIERRLSPASAWEWRYVHAEGQGTRGGWQRSVAPHWRRYVRQP